MTGDWLPLAQRLLSCEWADRRGRDGWCETHDDPWPCDRAQEAADVLAEELDQPLPALVRAGVLDVEPWRVKCTCGKRLEGSPDEVEAWVREHDDSPLSKHIIVWNPPSPRPWKRRYVTRWEDVE